MKYQGNPEKFHTKIIKIRPQSTKICFEIYMNIELANLPIYPTYKTGKAAEGLKHLLLEYEITKEQNITLSEIHVKTKECRPSALLVFTCTDIESVWQG